MEQGSLDFSGKDRKAAGIDLVLENEPEAWKDTVYALLLDLAYNWHRFTSDDLRADAGARGVPEPHHPNCWGAVFARAAKAGLIERVGFRHSTLPSCHARAISVWTRVDDDGAAC